MGAFITVCLADFIGVKIIAVLGALLVAYLYWLGIREKMDRRREREWLENKRRELTEKNQAQLKTK
jgi:hypothetical protein